MSVQWRHVWHDFSGFYSLGSVRTKSQSQNYPSTAIEKYNNTFSKSSRMVLQYIVSCTYKGCSNLTRAPPPNSTRGQRQQIYILLYHMPWKRTWYKFYIMALSYQYCVTYGRSPYCHFIKLLQNPNYNRRDQLVLYKNNSHAYVQSQ